MDDEQLKRRAWAGMVEFQRLIGGHAPGAEPLETEDFVASSVPGIPSSLMNAATPTDHEALAPHLDEIEGFYAANSKWGAWIDPGATEDVAALVGRGLVLDSSPVLMAAELDAIDEQATPRRSSASRCTTSAPSTTPPPTATSSRSSPPRWPPSPPTASTHTGSLQASKLGQGIYARLGYRSLGEVHLYEKRPA